MSQHMVSVSHGDPGVLPRIADAIALAGTGGTVVLQPGTYREELRLTGDVSLMAEDGRGTVTLEAPNGLAVFSSGATVQLRGLTITGGSDSFPAVQIGSGHLRMTECDVRANGVVAVHATVGRLDMHRCVVENPYGAGLLLDKDAAGTITDTVIRDIAGAAIVIAGGADPEFRGCTVTDGRGPGILSTRDGRGRMQDCQISAVDGPAIAVEEGGGIRIHTTVVHDTPGAGLVATGGRPTLEGCELRGLGGHGVVFAGQSDPILHGCHVVGTGGHGLLVLKNAAGLIDDCTIEQTASAAFAVTGSGRPALRGGHIAGTGEAAVLLDGTVTVTVNGTTVEGGQAAAAIRVSHGAILTAEETQVRGGGHGVLVVEGGQATFVSSDITGATVAGCAVESAAEVDLRNTRVHRCAGVGVRFAAGSRGWLTGCEVMENAGDGVVLETSEPVQLTETSVRLNRGEQIRVVGSTNSNGADSPGDPGSGPGAAPAVFDTSEVDSLLAELNAMTGLAGVKREMSELIDLLANVDARARAGLPTPSVSRHLAFAGPPGTGKTTVARLYGRLLAALGVLSSGQVVEVARPDLVGEYIGHTAHRTREAFERARGGVLFIDEAYALCVPEGRNDFGREAIDTLVTLMADHRDEVVVIVAGYDEEVASFLAASTGLPSLFTRHIHFVHYSPDELVAIFEGLVHANGYECSRETVGAVRTHLERVPKALSFGNGRYVRQLLDSAITRQAGRLRSIFAPSVDDLRTLRVEDVATGART